MQAFKTNEFFRGMTLPVPQQMSPLEAKLPMCTATVLDFLKVNKRYVQTSITTVNTWKFFCFQKCLDKDPIKRWTCDQLLNHEYFENFNFKVDETDVQSFEKLTRDRSRVRWKLRFNKNKIIFFCFFWFCRTRATACPCHCWPAWNRPVLSGNHSKKQTKLNTCRRFDKSFPSCRNKKQSKNDKKYPVLTYIGSKLHYTPPFK